MTRWTCTLRPFGLAFTAWLTAVAACSFPGVDIDPNAQCERDADCGESGYCLELRCVSCTSDAHCDGTDDLSRCSAEGNCVVCVADADCAIGVCDVASGRCAECATDADCDGQRCDDGTCVECLADDDCDDAGRCADRRCVECVEHSHCDPPYCLADQCVECIAEADCGGDGMTCDTELHICKPDHCSDEMPHENETDVDCGGVCPSCENGKMCVGDGDCASDVCVDDTCQACASSTDCPEDAYCDGEVCALRKPLGESCANLPDDACVTHAVCSQGVCCETDCSGTCQGCSEFVAGQPSGQCTQALPGTPCTNLELVPGTCTASGACSLLGLGG